ncbi:hypothetical protein ACF06X_33780 [Streptomyces sp. NPDC015346]|uniref:hypothetical protein n=1 Tax=Streptomyces sp. NPDC015346 TaxID=3364954 RepID=UPI00370023B3
MPDQVTRSPYCRKIRYGVTGAPFLSDPATLSAPDTGIAPTLVELVYSAARDDRPASISATVEGWWIRHGQLAHPKKKVMAHYGHGPAGWPQWLADETRLHLPVRHACSSGPSTTGTPDEH